MEFAEDTYDPGTARILTLIYPRMQELEGEGPVGSLAEYDQILR